MGKDAQVQKVQRVPNKMDTKRTSPRHIINMPKIKYKDRILKQQERKKHIVTYKGVLIRLSPDF